MFTCQHFHTRVLSSMALCTVHEYCWAAVRAYGQTG